MMISSRHVLFDHIQFKQNAFETYERVYYNLRFSTKASCGSSFQNFKAQCTVKYLVTERASNSQGSSRIFKSHCDQPEHLQLHQALGRQSFPSSAFPPHDGSHRKLPKIFIFRWTSCPLLDPLISSGYDETFTAQTLQPSKIIKKKE